jgi:putative molybdopterin biosynthesis protein
MSSEQSYLYLEIAESMRRLILTGELVAGERLPPVREMARRWHCTPSTVSHAYAILNQEELVTGRGGGGTVVTGGSLVGEEPIVQWASLVNRAERFLLEAIRSGKTPRQAEVALSIAISRWQDLQRGAGPAKDAPKLAGEGGMLRFVGSHDLLVEALARALPDRMAGATLSVRFVGSLGGLMALAQDDADVAGTHLWDEVTDRYNLPFIRRLLPGRRLVVLGLAERSLGLMVAPTNPLEIRELADLAGSGVRLVNRQAGSGTRVWLDAQSRALGIDPTAIAGYELEKLTHLAVARAIADGEGNAGLGILAAAAAYDLLFIPLARERYDLVFPEPIWESPVGQALAELVHSPQFKETVATLGGYVMSISGQEILLP